MSDEAQGQGPIEGIRDEAATEVDGVEAAAEGAPAPVKETAPESDESKKFAQKFAALSREEKKLRNERRELQKLKAEIEAARKGQEPAPTKEAEKLPLEMRLRKDPFKTLEELGVSYETLTRMALNDGKMTPELQMQLMREELKQEIEGTYGSELKKLREELKQKEEAAKAETQEAQVRAYKQQINDIVQAHKEEFELLSAEGEEAADLVYDIILKDFEAKKEESDSDEEIEVMSVQDAAKLVEDHLLEEAKKRIGLSKIKKLLEPQAPKDEPKVMKKASPTLSNEQAQVQGAQKRFLSDDESKAEAAKMIRWIE